MPGRDTADQARRAVLDEPHRRGVQARLTDTPHFHVEMRRPADGGRLRLRVKGLLNGRDWQETTTTAEGVGEGAGSDCFWVFVDLRLPPYEYYVVADAVMRQSICDADREYKRTHPGSTSTHQRIEHERRASLGGHDNWALLGL